ncbi:MAG: hypothetical protein JSU70_15715 [Phycisphaerales bacterium]|nr:MAG: hypothetical protein JSU70_15715 [Phycisphaerales bacterium]
MSKDRRGLQKKLSVLFDGVWIPKKNHPQQPPEVSTPVEQPQQQDNQVEEQVDIDEIVHGT